MQKILIVEDDPTIASLLCTHLQKWGYSVSCAEDFSNISAQAQQFDPHLIRDFLSYRRRHLSLQQMQNSIASLLTKLPPATTCIEKDYQILLKQ